MTFHTMSMSHCMKSVEMTLLMWKNYWQVVNLTWINHKSSWPRIFFSSVVIDKSIFLSATMKVDFWTLCYGTIWYFPCYFQFGFLSWNPTTLDTLFNNKNLAKKLKTSFLLPTITQGDLTHILFKSLPKFWILYDNSPLYCPTFDTYINPWCIFGGFQLLDLIITELKDHMTC